MDNSIPTALVSQPYLHNPSPIPAGIKYWGVQVDPTAELEATVSKYWKQGRIVVAAHALGDQAVELVIQAHEKAFAAQGITQELHSIQHAGFVPPDQVQRMKRLGTTFASFTVTPGSIHISGDYATEL